MSVHVSSCVRLSETSAISECSTLFYLLQVVFHIFSAFFQKNFAPNDGKENSALIDGRKGKKV